MCILVSLWYDRPGRVRALWCAVTRKYGGTARGSHSRAGRLLPGPELIGEGMFLTALVLTNTEELRKILHC